MTPNDISLIERAKRTTDWMAIDDLEEQASSQEAKNTIRNISIRMYHLDEFSSYGEM